jgi:hypothetical protein
VRLPGLLCRLQRNAEVEQAVELGPREIPRAEVIAPGE